MLAFLRYLMGKFVLSPVQLLAAELSHERKHFCSVLDHVSLGIVTIDADGFINFINTAAEELLGVEKGQVLGKYYQDIVHRNIVINHQKSILSLIGDTLHRGISYDGVELEALVNGNPGTIKFSTRILKDHRDRTAGVSLTLIDYTVPKLLEEQVQRNECLAAVGQMAAGVAHEIRNPLQSVKGFVQLLQEKHGDNKEVVTYTDIIISEIDRINSIIKEFLQLARPPGIKFEKKDLNPLVRDVVMLVGSEAILRNIVIEEDLGRQIPFVMLDESQIKQVLINLFSNALAAMPGSGTIKVKTWYDFHFNEARIAISDNGVGMDPETLRQIGKPFFTTKEEGTGLGLSLSFRIIRDHGGRIEVDSTLGKGTTFTIILPELAGMGEVRGQE